MHEVQVADLKRQLSTYSSSVLCLHIAEHAESRSLREELNLKSREQRQKEQLTHQKSRVLLISDGTLSLILAVFFEYSTLDDR